MAYFCMISLIGVVQREKSMGPRSKPWGFNENTHLKNIIEFQKILSVD